MLSRTILPGEPVGSRTIPKIKTGRYSAQYSMPNTQFDLGDEKTLLEVLANKTPPCEAMKEEQTFLLKTRDQVDRDK